MEITVSYRDQGVGKYLDELVRRSANMKPLWADFGAYMVGSVVMNFLAGGRPQKWAPLKEATKVASLGKRSTYRKDGTWTAAGQRALKGRKPLIDTGLLMNSHRWLFISGGVAIGPTYPASVYGRIHQFGGKTGPRVIRPKIKKALFWPGAAHPVKSVNHPGSVIPARPFLLVQAQDWAYLLRKSGTYLMTGGLI